jgi:effector-binding domain-containing protein
MKYITKWLAGFPLLFWILPAIAGVPTVVKVPAFKVIAVAAQSNQPVDFATAYGKLVGYYAQPGQPFQVVFPQITLSLNGQNYASIRFLGTVMSNGTVKVIALPACMFLKMSYIGSYTGIPKIIGEMLQYAHAKGYAVNDTCGIRIYELNSPDNTPATKLSHVIYVPITHQNH